MVTTKQITLSVQRLLKADVVKVFSFTAVATLVKVFTSFVSVKVVAVLIGPAGIALLGQLTNFSSIIMSVATGGINTGVTKYVAEYRNRQEIVRLFLSTAFRIILCFSLLCGLFVILFSTYLSKEILLDKEYGYVFRFFGFTIILYALNNFFVSILNGYKEFKKFALVGIVTSIVGLIFTISLVWLYEIKGALISAVTYQSVIFFVSLFLVFKSPWFSKENFTKGFSFKIGRKYAGFSLMALTSAATIPVAQLLIRGRLINVLNAEQAGLWEAMNKLSGMYLMVITTSFSVYYLPRLSEITDRKKLREEVLAAYKVIVPLLLIGFTFIFIIKIPLIQLLFSASFLPMHELFVWQLIGDLFKITSWLLAFLMIAKSHTKAFVFAEITFATAYTLLGMFLINYNGVVGIVQAYMICYIIYQVIVFVYVKKAFFPKEVIN